MSEAKVSGAIFWCHLLVFSQRNHRGQSPCQGDVVEKALQNVVLPIVAAATADLAEPTCFDAWRRGWRDLIELFQSAGEIGVATGREGVQPRPRRDLQAGHLQQKLGGWNPQWALCGPLFQHMVVLWTKAL